MNSLTTGYDPARFGCTSCGSQDTVLVDGIVGRRCASCLPTFDPTRAVELMVAGESSTALAYLRWSA